MASGTTSIGLLMIVSPGEEAIAADSLQRIARLLPGDADTFLTLVDNTGQGLAAVLDAWPGKQRILRLGDVTRPYFEIGRTVFESLHSICNKPRDLLVKVDPDTVVLSEAFFTDLLSLHSGERADFIAPMAVYQTVRHNTKRWFRQLADALPAGWSRTHGDQRFGSGRRFRSSPAWHARAMRLAIRKGIFTYPQPTGGGYALSGRILPVLKEAGMLRTRGHNGLEWNDDILLPTCVRAVGGRVVDIRQSPFARGWRWMHGDRYFGENDLAEPGLRALHPLKESEEDWALRRQIPRNPPG